MDVGIIKSVSLVLIPDNSNLISLIKDYSHPTEEVLVVSNVEDFVSTLATLMSEENSFITCYVDDSSTLIDFIHENLLTSIQSGVITAFPKGVILFKTVREETYVPPPHIKNIIESSNLVQFMDILDIEKADQELKLKFFMDLCTHKSTIQFHLYNQIALFKQSQKIEDCQQAILMVREDLGRLYNPNDVPKENLFKSTVKLDLRDLNKQVQRDLKDGTYSTGSIDWVIAYVFVNRAKVFFSILASVLIFCVSYFENIYKVYHAFNHIIPNWEYVEKLVDKEKTLNQKKNSQKN